MKSALLLFVLSVTGVCISGDNTINRVTSVHSMTNHVMQTTAPEKEVRCKAITKSGKRCKRKHTAGSEFCKQHKLINERKKKNVK